MMLFFSAEGKVYCWGMRRKLKDKDLMSKAVKKALEVPILGMTIPANILRHDL